MNFKVIRVTLAAASPDVRASDKSDMSAGCCSTFATLSRAAARYASAIVRRAGIGAVHPDWHVRAAVCEQCPMRMIVGNVSYCGQPLHKKRHREVEEGCGCPTREKARSPEEHCPLTATHRRATTLAGSCDCKWCGSD